MISIVSPVYKAEKIISILVDSILEQLNLINENYEIILVDDNSPDDSWTKITEICLNNDKVKGIKLSKNFGQHIAISAGLRNCNGDFIVIMDCDMQDSPVYINEMLLKCKSGFDIVYTYKEKRKHNFIKNATAFLFNKLFNYLSDNQKSNYNVGSFSMITKQVAVEFNKYNDSRRHYLMLLRQVGFKSTYINVKHNKRHSGKSSYNIQKLLNHAIDGITFNSTKLLKLSIVLGLFISVFSLIWGSWVLYNFVFYSVSSGYTSIMLLLSISTGLILSSIGITGFYIANIFEQVKNHPLYIIDKKLNFNI